MVKKSITQIQKMHKILKKNGAKYDKSGNIIKGSWDYGTIPLICKECTVERGTVYSWLKKYPKAPTRARGKHKSLKPEYLEKWEDSDTVKEFIDAQTAQEGSIKRYVSIGLECFKLLNNKDPSHWTEEDFKFLWKHEHFREPETGRIKFHKAVAIRRWMALFYPELANNQRYTTKGLKTRIGEKKTEYLGTEKELTDVANNISFPDTLIMFDLGIQCGGRFSSFSGVKNKPKSGIRIKDIDFNNNVIMMLETKVNKKEERLFNKRTMKLLKRYIKDMGFTKNQRIFPRKLTHINKDLTRAGKRANIPFTLTSHTAMKHTFVSFASNHGVSLQIVADQTGTDPKTLMDFYAGLEKKRKRAELLGEKWEKPDFHEVIERLQKNVFEDKYDAIKDKLKFKLRNGKVSTIKKSKKRMSWEAVRKMLDSEKTPKQLKKYWRPRYKLHTEGVSNTEIKRILG